MALSISSIDPTQISTAGGEVVRVLGTIPASQAPYSVYVGPSGDETDEPAASAIIGQAYSITPETEDYLEFVAPPVEKGTQNIYIKGSSENDSTTISVLESNYQSAKYNIRNCCPAFTETGPRRIELEPSQ